VKLDVVPTMAEHPIRTLIDAGVTCTISTDDPISFGNFLDDEYRALATDLNFSFAELAQLARNGFVTADLAKADKEHWLSEIDRALAAHA
jgi:adenosine deaminase